MESCEELALSWENTWKTFLLMHTDDVQCALMARVHVGSNSDEGADDVGSYPSENRTFRG